MKNINIFLSLLIVSSASMAQITTPAPSPVSTVSQKAGVGEFSVTYSRPSAKGRKIYGDVVPFDVLWRFGANSATTLKSTEDFSIQGNKIPAGEYSVFAIPGAAEWTIIINKTAKMGGTSAYKQEEDQLRFKVKPETVSYKTETFTIQFANLRNNAAAVEIVWENTKVSFDIDLDFDAKIMKQIDETMAGPGAGSYQQAANYYFNNGKDLNKALEYVNKSLEKGGDKYWILALKAQIQAGLNDFKGAVETANKSIELAKADKDDNYVKMNTTHIAEWTPKIPAGKAKKS